MYCTKCGAQKPDNAARFCAQCGAVFSAVDLRAVPPASAPYITVNTASFTASQIVGIIVTLGGGVLLAFDIVRMNSLLSQLLRAAGGKNGFLESSILLIILGYSLGMLSVGILLICGYWRRLNTTGKILVLIVLYIIPFLAWVPFVTRSYQKTNKLIPVEPAGGLTELLSTQTDIGQDAGMSTLAIVAGYLGLIAVMCAPAPFALVVGILAAREIKRDPTGQKYGMGRAVFGIVMGGIFTVLGIVVLIMQFFQK